MTTGTNNFLTFAYAGGANVVTQATYAGLAAIGAGYSSGTAQSAQLNKTWRQSSVIANAVAQLVANHGIDALDDGTTAIITALANMLKMQGYGGGTPNLKTATGSLLITDAGRINIDATGGNIVLTLPAVSAANGQVISYAFVRIDNTVNTVTIQRAGSDTIGNASGTSISLPTQWDGVEIFGNGVSAWRVLNAGYAKQAGSLTSGATATTQAYGDNTTLIATDAFVQAAKGNASVVQSVSANGTLTSSSVGALTVFTGGAITAATLFTPTNNGQRMSFANNHSSGGTVVLTAPSGNFVNQSGYSSTTLSMVKGSRVSVVWDGTNFVVENWSSIGEGQVWTSDLGPSGSAQRASGTTYTNTTGRPIMVTIGITAVSGSPGIVVVVGGSQIYGFYPPYGTGNPLSFIVPPGTTYSGTLNAGTTLTNWNELR